MKTTSSFKLSKQIKRTMATIVNKDLRDAYKQVMISAQVDSLKKPEKEKGV